MTHRIGKAIAIAAEVHKEQVDKGDEPYMYHVWEVMNRGKERCLALGITDPETITTIMCLCVLHDALEDFEGTPIERGHLRDRISNDCGSQVLARLDILTKRKGEPYDQYIERVAKNWMTRLAKLCDLSHNMEAWRIPTGQITEKDFQRWDKYHRAFVRLMRED